MTTRIKLTTVLAAGLFLTMATACNNSNSSATTVQSNEQRAPAATETTTSETTTTGATAGQQQSQQPATAAGPAATIPDFTFFILRSGIRFTKQDLAKTGNIVFILFDPTCSHCQHEANALGKHYDRIKHVNLYFVSMNDPALMASFLDTWAAPLVGKENIEVLYDRGAEFINKFHIPSQYPATYVYGADGKLKEYWDGEREINQIIDAINQ